MLHPAELEREDCHEVELAERVRDRRVLLEPRERVRVQVEDRLTVASHLGGIRLAMEHSEIPSVPPRGLYRKLARHKRKQVGRNRLRLSEPHARPLRVRLGRDRSAVGHRLPPDRHVERQTVAGLQVGLIEAGKRAVGPRGNEQRVQGLPVAVEGVVARDEINGELVLSRSRRLCRNRQMAVAERDQHVAAAGLDAEHLIAGLREVNDHTVRRFQREA